MISESMGKRIDELEYEVAGLKANQITPQQAAVLRAVRKLRSAPTMTERRNAVWEIEKTDAALELEQREAQMGQPTFNDVGGNLLANDAASVGRRLKLRPEDDDSE